MHIPWPGPAADIRDAGVVYGDDGNALARRTARSEHAQVVRFAFEALDQVASPEERDHKRDDYAEEPVGLPKILPNHPRAPALRSQTAVTRPVL